MTKLNPAGTAVLYSTYFGGDASDTGRGIFVDTLGNAYVAGTYAIPTALDLRQSEVLVAKFSSTGGLIYATTFGSADDDIGYAVTVDAAGFAYVTGTTGAASDFPTTPNALQPTWGGFNDAFLSVLTPDGASPRGTRPTSAADWAMRGAQSPWIPSRPCTLQARPRAGFRPPPVPSSGTCEGLATHSWSRFDGDGSGTPALMYSTLLGGADFEIAYSIAVDSSGNAYVTGSTDSGLDFPVTTTAFQKIGAGETAARFLRPRDCQDAFMTKLNSTGSALIYSTYLGGPGNDLATGSRWTAQGARTSWAKRSPRLSSAQADTAGEGKRRLHRRLRHQVQSVRRRRLFHVYRRR